MTMIADHVTTPVEPPRPRRIRRLWWLAAVVVLVTGGAVTGGEVAAHYAHAAPLTCACGLGWADPDAARSKNITAGPWRAIQVPARPGHAQTFYVEIANWSSVTQTVLGLTSDYAGDRADPAELAVAVPTGSSLGDQQSEDSQHYSSAPNAIPPGGTRYLRFTIHTSGPATNWPAGRTLSWTYLQVRVRVGMFTRTETIDFDQTAFVLSGTTPRRS